MNATSNSKGRKGLPLLFLVIVAGLVAWGAFREGGWLAGETTTAVAGQAVRRGPLRITVVQRGNLSAKNSARVTSQVEGNVQILELIDEGERVEKGQIVGKLDASGLIDSRLLQDITVQNAQAALTKAQQSLEIQKSQNTSDIAKAEQDLIFAKQDYNKYKDGDWPQALQKAEEDIVLADADLAQAETRKNWSKILLEKDFLTRTEFDTDVLVYNRASIKLAQTKRAKELLEEYDNKKQMAVYEAAIEEAERELDRVKLQAAARLIDMEAAVRGAEARATLETEKLAKLNDQIEKSILVAPASGIVVYSRGDGGRWGRQGDLIEEGASVRERQELITIPQAGGMVAEASLHESVIKKVSAGMPVEISVDALAPAVFHGKVNFVAVVPDSGSYWSNPNARLFRTEIGIDDANPEMRPAMSCSVEILVEEFADTLYVPLQAVFRRGTQTICFVDGKERKVEAGAANEEWVQILSGLQEGEIVAMSPPTGFQEEVASMNQNDGQDKAADGAQSGDGRPSGRPTRQGSND